MAAWFCCLSVGSGATAWLFSRDWIQKLAPLAYPFYLFHIPTAYYYYFLVYGPEPRTFMPAQGGYPVPVEWWEFFLIALITLFFSYIANEHLAPPLVPYTIRGTKFFFKIFCCCGKCSCCPGRDQNSIAPEGEQRSALETLQEIILNLSGATVTPDSDLTAIGIDSFGINIFLGIVRDSFPATGKDLKPALVVELATVGGLAEYEYNNNPKHTHLQSYAITLASY